MWRKSATAPTVRAMGIPRLVSTERLHLAIPGPADAGAVLHYFQRNEAHLGPWEPTRPPEFSTLGFWRGRLDRSLEEAAQGTSARYFLIRRDRGVKDPSRVIGTASFTNISGGAFYASFLGYGLDHQAEGRGLMFEALSALLPAVMDSCHLNRVMANYMPSNHRSGRLLERLGFEIEGFAKDYLFIDGAWRDHVLTSFRRAGAPPPPE